MTERPRCEKHDKAIYPSLREANSALHALRHLGSDKVPVRSYWTEECGCYHLTSNPPKLVSTSRKTARAPRRRKGSRKRS